MRLISIPKWSDFNVAVSSLPNNASIFQSQNGLILTVTYTNDFIEDLLISIPKWSDFNPIISQVTVSVRCISIPKWSDFNPIVKSVIFVIPSISIPKWSDFNSFS